MEQFEVILQKHAFSNDSRIKSFVTYLDERKAKTNVKISDIRYFGKSSKIPNSRERQLKLSNNSSLYYKIIECK